jgi:hypothetical protein
MNKVIAALIANGFSLPASIMELKNYETNSLNLKIKKDE